MPAGTKENNHGTITIPEGKNVTLDLNGQTLTKTSAGTAFLIADGPHTFEITDSGTGGKIVHTYDVTTIDSTKTEVKNAKSARYSDQSVISVGSVTDSDAAGATFNMTGGTIESNTTCVYASNKSNVNIGNNSTLQSFMSTCVYLGNDGHKDKENNDAYTEASGGQVLNVTGNAHLITGVDFTSNTTETVTGEGDNATITKNNVAITKNKNSNLPAIQVSGNYANHEGTKDRIPANKLQLIKITISDNSVIEFRNDENTLLKSGDEYLGNPSAVYIGGYAKLNIQDNAKITSGGTGVEIRAGYLEVTGGTVTSNATKYTARSNSDGSSTFGAAIAISQHTTEQSVDVKISGSGTNISGPNALAVSNPEKNGINQEITATIDGGNLTSTKPVVTGNTSQSGNAILADKTNVFITVNDGNLNGNVSVTKVANASETQENTQKATVVVAGGTTTGTVKVVEVGNEGESTPTDATTNLKVMGGKISDTTSAKAYKTAGVEVNDDGTVTESTKNQWSLTSAENHIHHYMLAGDTATSLLAVTVGGTGADSVYLKYDSTNKLFGIPYSATQNYKWDGGEDGDAKKGRYLAGQTIAGGGGAVSIRPWTSGVKITGTGFIDNTIITLTANDADSLGIVVDATGNRLAYIKGGAGEDSIKAGDRRTTLDGGENDDTLDGGDGIDTFYYSAGNDEIRNYEHGTDAVSITGAFTPPIDFTKATFGGRNFIFTFGDDEKNKLTFRNTSKVSLLKDNKVYTYEGNTSGNLNYMAIEGEGISLGTGYSGRFNGAATANADYETINGARVNSAIRITGNDNPNFIVASSVGGGTLEGGEGDDTLMAIAGGASTASLRFEGGAGDDSLVGGAGYNLFVYTEGDDKIKGYHDKDLVTVRGNAANLETADFAFTDNNIKLGFESNDDNLTFENVSGITNGVSVQSGKNLYVYKKDRIARNDEVITLTAGFEAESFGSDIYNTINAVKAAYANGVSISGNDNNNVIFGSSLGGGLFGGKGNDKLNVTERVTGENPAKFVFKYDEGKDTVSGFVAGNDKLDITAKRLGEISKAKSSKGDTRLAFTFNTSKSDVLTFNSDGDEIGRVSLSDDNGFLTKDGVVSIDSGGNRLDLFASAKGKIDLTDTLYSVSGGIKTVDASDVAKQSVTLIGGTQGGQFTFAVNNKKKDQFEYNGGNVTISGYEAGKDRLNLNTAALTGFTVGTDDKNVSLSGAGDDVVVLEGMKEQEVLLHHAESKRNSFTKMVFKKDGVILNKEKRPTAATVYSGTYNASDDNSVKKIFVADGASSIAITAGGKNKTTLDASASNGNISLTGGAKNDKLIGSTAAADTFVYTAGKDIIQNYGSNDQISLGSFATSLTSAKISAGSRSIKFKFSNKNSLTIKPAKGSTLGSALDISGIPKYTYSKNAIISGSNATLTSEFSGSYRLKNSGVNNVDGSLVKKNLTFRGTSSDETLAGGTKKTTFKGGGGNDAFTGGSGNDIFFYAKGDKGDATIADFDFDNDKLKIASGTITKISTVSGGGIQFDMNKGKTSANVGSFKITSSATYDSSGTKTQGDFNPNSTLIKANNTYLWFADDDVKDDDGNVLAKAGDLITTVSKVSKSDTTGYAVIDLGYSSNLVNAGVATKVTGTFNNLKPTSSNSGGGTN